MINSNDLRFFLVTAEHLHLTKAAQALGLTQPALSHAIKRLEADVQKELFLRRKNGLLLTEAGSYLAMHGKRIMEELIAVEDFLVRGKARETKTFSLGMHPSVGHYILPQLLKTKLDIKLKYFFGLSREVTEWVQEGKIDCAVAINPHPHPNLILSSIGEDEFTLWRPTKLKDQNTLFFDPNLHQSHYIIRQLEKQDHQFNSYVEIPNLELISKTLFEGLGCAILPARVVKENQSWVKSVQQVDKIKPFKDKISFVYSNENQFKDDLKMLKHTMTSLLK